MYLFDALFLHSLCEIEDSAGRTKHFRMFSDVTDACGYIYMCTYTYAWVYMCVHATNTNLYMYVGAACGACVNKNTNKLSAVHI